MHKTTLAAALLLLASSHVFAGKWDKSLNLSLAASETHTRIHVANDIYEKRTTGLEFTLDASLNGRFGPGNLKNSLKIDYAGTKTKDQTNPWGNPRWTESSDQLILDSVYRLDTDFFVQPYIGENIQTAVFDTNPPGEWAAFRPMQMRDSFGLSLSIMDSGDTDFSLRVGVFHQHYINPGKVHRDPVPGLESVLEFDGNLAKNIAFTSKAGLYTGIEAVDDFGNPETQSRKAVLEWDNELVLTLSKVLAVKINYNVDNKDVSSEQIGYEVDHRTSLALTWQVF
jgi:hypothetical protein